MNTNPVTRTDQDSLQTNVSPYAAAPPVNTASNLKTIITPVYLNLYDLGGCANACIHTVGLSFYHCAVQAHSAEYG